MASTTRPPTIRHRETSARAEILARRDRVRNASEPNPEEAWRCHLLYLELAAEATMAAGEWLDYAVGLGHPKAVEKLQELERIARYGD